MALPAGVTIFIASLLAAASRVPVAGNHTGITIETCKLRHGYDKDAVALAQVYITSEATHDPLIRDDQLSCAVSGREAQASQMPVILDFILEGDSPEEISLQMTNDFLHQLRATVIVCSYSEIGQGSRVNHNSPSHSYQNLRKGTYHCDTSLARIIFTGMPSETSPVSRHRRDKRSVTATNPQCYRETFRSEEDPEKLGDWCSVDRATKRAYRYMIDEKGNLSCLICCEDHHYDEESKGCKKCPPGTTQSQMNTFRHCLAINGNTLALTELPTPTTSTRAEQKNSGPTTTGKRIPKKRKRMQAPVHKPTGLVATIVGQDYAFIEWNDTIPLRNMKVQYYLVEIFHFGENKSASYKVEGGRTWIKLLELSPQSCYDVTVEACNRAGSGPRSQPLEVHTLHDLPKVENLHILDHNSNIGLEWDEQLNEYDLTTKVEIRQQAIQSDTWWTFSGRGSNGRIKIPLHPFSPGNYTIQVYYAADNREGPRSDPHVTAIKINEEKKFTETENVVQESCSNGWLIAFWSLFAFVCIVVIVLFMLVKRKKIHIHVGSSRY